MTVKQPPCHLAYSEVAFSCAEADPEPAAPFGPANRRRPPCTGRRWLTGIRSRQIRIFSQVGGDDDNTTPAEVQQPHDQARGLRLHRIPGMPTW